MLHVVIYLQLTDHWDPHGSPQPHLSGPVLPPGTPFPNQPQHRTSVPDSTEGFDLIKPDPYDLYEKSRAIYESRREWPSCGLSRTVHILWLIDTNLPCMCWRSRVRGGGGTPVEGEDRVRLPHLGRRWGCAGCESGRPWQGSYGTGSSTHIFDSMPTNLVCPAPNFNTHIYSQLIYVATYLKIKTDFNNGQPLDRPYLS